MTELEAIRIIKRYYLTRGCWISDIARKFNAPYEATREIIVALGFSRGKYESPVSDAQLLNDAHIKNLLERYFCS